MRLATQLPQPRLDSRARRTPGPLLSGQRDPPIGALGPALGRWILAPYTHRASLPRFAARADWLQYRTPKPNQRLQPPPPPPLPLPRKMANLNKGESGLPPTAFAQAPLRPRPITRVKLAPPPRRSTAQASRRPLPLPGFDTVFRQRTTQAPSRGAMLFFLNTAQRDILRRRQYAPLRFFFFPYCPPFVKCRLGHTPLGPNAQALFSTRGRYLGTHA